LGTTVTFPDYWIRIDFLLSCIIFTIGEGADQMIRDEAIHRRLINRLKDALVQRGERSVEVIETHISSIVLAGNYAYKIKKPLDFGFLDFSTLGRRHFCCKEEIRLNSRLAPNMYLDVVSITGTIDEPQLEGTGIAIEYAVRMRRFDQAGLLSTHVDGLSTERVDEIARTVATFHLQNAVAEPGSRFGSYEQVSQPMLDNFEHIGRLLQDPGVIRQINSLEQWTRRQHKKLEANFKARREDGYIRECHGDLHLGNMTLVDGEVVIFDGIEFSPELRWIDTMSELAFLLMDLDEKGHPELSTRALNSYLEVTGDYGGIALLPFYQVYRAMVRAKVCALRINQVTDDPQLLKRERKEFQAYLDQAEGYTDRRKPSLVLTHGVSGSGKSFAARQLLSYLPAIWIRSDVERKRLAGMNADEMSESSLGEDLYSPDFTERTYLELYSLTDTLLSAGFAVIVDATFLKRHHRQRFYKCARMHEVPLVVIDFQVNAFELRRRVAHRIEQKRRVSEADMAVLEAQLKHYVPLARDELDYAISISEGTDDWISVVMERCNYQAARKQAC